jgi:hypothetical protein
MGDGRNGDGAKRRGESLLMNEPRLRQLGIATVISHLIVVTPHSIAHTHLQIEMNSWQNIYIGVVILLGPIVSAVLLGMRRKVGSTLLALSMAGSLLFGVYYHFIAAGPDNVASLHPHAWTSTFQLSAVLLAVTELCGTIVGVIGTRYHRFPTGGDSIST